MLAAKFLISKGADVNAKSEEGLIAADIARVGGERIIRGGYLDPSIPGHYREVLQLLVENGADVNAKTWRGYTPLHMVALYSKYGDGKGLQTILGAATTQPAGEQ